jgi:hypothetical protein
MSEITIISDEDELTLIDDNSELMLLVDDDELDLLEEQGLPGPQGPAGEDGAAAAEPILSDLTLIFENQLI